MASAPLLTAAQFKRIEGDLPTNRRDRVMISAILYRATSGQSVREAADAFGVTKTRLSEWDQALTDALPRILRALRLEPAGGLMWRGGGQDWRKRSRSGQYERVTALRLEHFRDALRYADRR